MCLDRECNTGFLLKSIALVLSHNIDMTSNYHINVHKVHQIIISLYSFSKLPLPKASRLLGDSPLQPNMYIKYNTERFPVFSSVQLLSFLFSFIFDASTHTCKTLDIQCQYSENRTTNQLGFRSYLSSRPQTTRVIPEQLRLGIKLDRFRYKPL